MMARRRRGKPTAPETEDIDIPEEEQWRIINQSGILKIPNPAPVSHLELEDSNLDSSLADEVFNAVLLIIPFSFLLLMLDILVRRQYSQEATLALLAERMISGIPILSGFIFYTTRHKANPRMQLFLFILSLAVGARLVYVVNRASWRVLIRQCPPLGTIWVYTIVQLELLPAVVGLSLVAAWVWWTGLKIIL